MSPALRQARRGGAMVEFALLNVILIPLLLYSVFLMDVPHMKLETQETAVSSVWDYTTHNSSPSPWGDSDDAWSVTKENAFVWADHTSAYDDGADPTKGTYTNEDALHGEPHAQHHTGFGAQYAFNFQSGPDTQINCNMKDRDVEGSFDSKNWDADLSWAKDPSFLSFSGGSMAPGGLGHCFVTAFIYDYIVPQGTKGFFAKFSKGVAMTTMEYRSSGPGKAGGESAHKWQPDNFTAKHNIPAFAEGGVSYNTWALRNGAEDGKIDNADLQQPPASNPFMQGLAQANTAGPLTATWKTAQTMSATLTAKSASGKLLAIPTGFSALGLPVSVDLYLQARYEKGNPGLETHGFESTPYDDVNSKYSVAYGKRGPYYLGCKNQETYPCP